MTRNRQIPSVGKHYHYDHETRDFAMYYDGEYIGSVATSHEAETRLDEHAAARAEYDSQLNAMDQAIGGALETALEDADRSARYARAELEAIESDRETLQRARKLFEKGIRPVRLTDGSWQVESERGTGIYQVNKYLECTCPDSTRRKRICKHAKLVVATERAFDYQTTQGHGDPAPEYTAAAAAMLGTRLARARSRVMEAA